MRQVPRTPVRNKRGQLQADLAKDDFEIYEGGVKQEVISFTSSIAVDLTYDRARMDEAAVG